MSTLDVAMISTIRIWSFCALISID